MSEDVLSKKRIPLVFKVIITIFILLLNAICSYFRKPYILLSENQILYMMSTIAQVIAGLFGLVLAAYAIIDPKLKAEGDKDDDVQESLNILRRNYFKNIMMLSVFCATTIFSCLLSIGCFEKLPAKIIQILLNQSILLCAISVISFLIFGCSLLNPNALSNLNRKALIEVNSEYSEADLQLRPFIEYYNRLEKLIYIYVSELMEDEISYSDKCNKYKQEKMQFFQALDILNMHQIINKDIYYKLDELRRYRNALVHSIEEIRVNSVVFNDLQELYEKLKAVYENRENETIYREKVLELYQLGRQISLTEKDKEILRLMYNNPNITLKDIAIELQCSKSYLNSKIKELISREKISLKEGKYKVLVDSSEFVNTN